MYKKIIVASGVEPNRGIVQKTSLKLQALNKALLKIVKERIFLHLDNSGALTLAEDASLTNPKTAKEKEQLRLLKEKILSTYKQSNPQAVKSDITKFVKENINKWLAVYSKESEQICDWLVRNIVSSTTHAQKQALLKSGFPSGQFSKWKIPTVNNQYTSVTAHAIAEEFKEKMLLNVVNDTTKQIYKSSDWIADWILGNNTLDSMPKESLLEDRNLKRFVDSHANAISQMTQRANCADLGITEGIWIHVAGQFTSRDSHKRMNGKRFKLSEGLFDEEVGRNVLTGELPYCRCIYQMIVPDELLNEG